MRLGDDEQERSVVASGAGAEDAKPIRPLLPDFWCATVALLATCLVLTQVGWLAQIDVIPKGLPIVLMVVIAALGFALSIAGRHASSPFHLVASIPLRTQRSALHRYPPSVMCAVSMAPFWGRSLFKPMRLSIPASSIKLQALSSLWTIAHGIDIFI